MAVTIYHNPSCGTSRNTLAMIRQSGGDANYGDGMAVGAPFVCDVVNEAGHNGCWSQHSQLLAGECKYDFPHC